MTFRIFVPTETLININLSLNLFTSTTFSTHFSATSTPTPANPSLPTPPLQKNLYLLPFSPSDLTPSLSTLFPENNKNPVSFCLPYRPTPHLYPSSTQHSMSRLSTGNPMDYQAF